MTRFFGILTAVLITISIAASCSSSTGSQTKFEGQRIGNWLTTTPTTLQWVGAASVAKQSHQILNSAASSGDTTFYARPNGNELTLYSKKNNDIFSITYRDSSYSYAAFDTTEAAERARFIDPFDKEANNGSMGISDDHMHVTTTVTAFNCDSTYNLDPSDDFEFHILNDSGGVYETIIIDTDGVVDAMHEIGCQ